MKTAQARPCVPSAVSDLRVCCAVPLCQDHVAAVMSVDYSPTGREFASGAYDRTVRLWDVWNAGGGVGGVGGSGGRSRDVYHTKRMQRVWSVRWSWDAQYVMSGSDDTNLRMWKGRASARLGVQTPRERQAREYRDRLVGALRGSRGGEEDPQAPARAQGRAQREEAQGGDGEEREEEGGGEEAGTSARVSRQQRERLPRRSLSASRRRLSEQRYSEADIAAASMQPKHLR